MNQKLKTLQSLVLQASQTIVKLKGENKRLAQQADSFDKENRRLQVLLRERHGTAGKRQKVKKKLERIYNLLEKLDHPRGAS